MTWKYKIQACLRDISGSVPDYNNKVSIAIKWVTLLLLFFWFLSVHESYVYTYCSLLSMQ